MGLDLQYKAGESQIRLRLNSTDIDIIEQSAGVTLRHELDIVMDVPDFGIEVDVSRDILIKSLDSILEFLQSDQFQPQYVYGFKCRVVANEEIYSTGSGSFSGFKIDGEYHCITGGLNNLVLEKYGINAEGVGFVVETKDIRHLKRLSTETHGDIIITKRKKSNSLLKLFKELKEFVANQDTDVIKKTLG